MRMLEVSSENMKFEDFEKLNEDLDSVLELSPESEENEDGIGFVGKAFIYDEEIAINTYTGQGYDTVVRKMKNYIDWYSGKIRLAGFEREDIKQLIVMILLDGIRRYNPRLKIKLSTFLYVHIKNRIISRIKEETRQSLNATYHDPFYKFICSCGASFVSSRSDAAENACHSCKKKVDSTWTIRAEHHEPLSLDGIMNTMNDDGESNDKGSRIHYNGRKNNFIDFFGKIDTIEDLDKNMDFSNILRDEDEVTRKIAELMYNEDYSITDAAKEVGLTCWAASLRLKKLKGKRNFKDFFLNR